jgi:type II secretory pathway pseudopilin PulG
MKHFIITSPQFNNTRLGATLIEILMAMMIMSVGMVMIASIFPMAIRRSVQASQLTNATLVRYQAEDLIRMYPGLLPNANVFKSYTLGSATINNANRGETRVCVTDPLGYFSDTLKSDPTTRRTYYGNFNNAPVSIVNAGRIPVIYSPYRLNGGFNDNQWMLAQNTMTMRDTWSSEWTAMVQAYTANSVTFGAEEELLFKDFYDRILTDGTSTNYTFDILGRLELLDANLQVSQVRTFSKANINLSTPGSPRVQFTPNLPSAATSPPNGFVPSTGRVELLEPRYSWMLTTRSIPSPGLNGTIGDDDDEQPIVLGGDIIVYFKRAILPSQETLYDIVKNQSDVTKNTISITWPSGTEKPNIKPSGYFFDPQHGYWYKIKQIAEVDELSSPPRVKLIYDGKLHKPVTKIIIPEQIVAVFPYIP